MSGEEGGAVEGWRPEGGGVGRGGAVPAGVLRKPALTELW